MICQIDQSHLLKTPIASTKSIQRSLTNGSSKKTTRRQRKGSCVCLCIAKSHSLYFVYSLSLPDVHKLKGFTEQQSNNLGLQKRVQSEAGCKEIHAAVVEALLAAAASITKHTVPEVIATDSNTNSNVSSLSDKGFPYTNKRKSSTQKPNTVQKKFQFAPHQVLLDRSAKMKEKEMMGSALSYATI